MWLQFAPLVRAQGNMSDATGNNNPFNNLSDVTGILISSQVLELIAALREGRFILGNGLIISAEVGQLLISVSSGNQASITQFTNILVRQGISLSLARQLALDCVGVFGANGQINVTQLSRLFVTYQTILVSQGISIEILSGIPEFASVAAIIGQLTRGRVQFPGLEVGIVAGSLTEVQFIRQLISLRQGQEITIRGVNISGRVGQLILALSNGEQQGIGQLVSLLVRGGVQGSLASEFARSLRGIFNVSGSINRVQFTRAIALYREVITRRGASISFLNQLAEFRALQAIFLQFAIEFPVPVIIGNQSDINPDVAILPDDTEDDGETDSAEESDDQEIADGDVDDDDGDVDDDDAGNQSDGTNSTVEVIPISAEIDEDIAAQLDAVESQTTQSETTTITTITTATTSETVVSNGNNNSSGGGNNVSSAGESVAGGAIVTTSDIAGGFAFVSTQIRIAINQSASFVLDSLSGGGNVVFAGRSISVQAQQTVRAVLVSSNTAAVEGYVSSLTAGGIASNYAQALAETVQGIISTNASGEVTAVNATKLVLGVSVYNATINSMSSQAIANIPGEMACTGYALSQMRQAGVAAAEGRDLATIGLPGSVER